MASMQPSSPWALHVDFYAFQVPTSMIRAAGASTIRSNPRSFPQVRLLWRVCGVGEEGRVMVCLSGGEVEGCDVFEGWDE